MRHVYLLCLVVLVTTQNLASAAIPSCIPAGIVAWWPGDGNVTERINGNNGTLQGGASFAPGRVGQAFSLDGSTGYVLAPDGPLWNFGSNDFTVDFWANFSSMPSSDIVHPAPVFIAHDEGPGNLNKWIFAYGGGMLFMHVNSPSTGPMYPIQVAYTFALRQWYHIALTRSGNTFSIYVNGASVGSQTSTVVVPAASAPLTIGQAESAGTGQSLFLNGLIDEVEIYNRALSVAEINNIFLVGSNGVKCLVLGIDISGDTGNIKPSEWQQIRNAGQTFVIVDAWRGNRKNPLAAVQLRGARLAGLKTAAYCLLSFDKSAKPDGTFGGSWQVSQAIEAVGPEERRFIAFIAIDIEQAFPLGSNQAERLQRISEAVQKLASENLKAIIHTNRDNWTSVTGDTHLFSSAPLSVPLWDNWNDFYANLTLDGTYALGCNSTSAPPASHAWIPYGGWPSRAGKQYDIGCKKGPARPELDIFDGSLFP